MKALPISRSRRGAALIMSLMLISALTILALFLFERVRLAERSGTAFTESFRARQAVAAGLEIIQQRLILSLQSPETGENSPHSTNALTFRPQNDHQGLVLANFDGTNWNYLPLFSGANQPPPTPTVTTPAITLQEKLPADLRAAVNAHYETLTGTPNIGTSPKDPLYPATPYWMETRPEAGLEYVTIPSTAPIHDSRDVTERALIFAYTSEDLNGLIDASTAGNDHGPSGTHLRLTGQSDSDIALFTALDDALPTAEYSTPATMIAAHKNTNNNTHASRLIQARKSGPVDFSQLFPYDHSQPNTSPTNQIALVVRRNLIANRAETPSTETIPYGFGYIDEGKPKRDINDFVKNKDVDGLAEFLKKNLPKWQERSSKLHPDYDYYKTIAANCIDYADQDSDSTSGPGYRGLDNFPLITKYYHRYSYFERTNDSKIIVEIETWAELWNQSNIQVTGTARFADNNQRNINGFKLAELKIPTYETSQLTLAPNEFRVLNVGTHKYELTFESPYTAPSTGSPLTFQAVTPSPDPTKNTTYQLYWNGTLVDFCRGGLQGSGFTYPQLAYSDHNSRKSDWRWLGMANPHLHLTGGQVADPRASIYIHGTDGTNGSESYVHHRTYASNTFWGSKNFLTTGAADYNSIFHSIWPDGAFHLLKHAQPPNSNTNSPLDDGQATTIAAIQNPHSSVSRFSNLGYYQNIAELGNIFDPLTWSGLNQKTGFQSTGTKCCGGSTLRIGRAEHYPFHKDGLRASELLNLLTVKTQTPTKRRPININTANSDVLRALFAGVQITADAEAINHHDSSNTNYKNKYQLYPPSLKKPADIIADAIITARKISPIRTLSDLSDAINPTADSQSDGGILGNPTLWPSTFAASANAPIEWKTFTDETIRTGTPSNDLKYYAMSDAAREELFLKTAPLTTTTSHSFRIWITGMSAEKRANTWRITGTSSQTNILTVNSGTDGPTIKIHATQTP